MPTASPPPPLPLPTWVIGGYLGAGKTTLINALLRQAAGRRIAVLVNDFGEVSIDADLIVGAQAGVLSLAGGCLCCSFGDDLVGTLINLKSRVPTPDVVLIELSGVALPALVVRTARLALGIDVLGTWVLADATAVRRQAADPYVGDTVRQQLGQADGLLLSKTDLLDEATWRQTCAWLASQRPGVPLLIGGPGSGWPVELMLGWQDGTLKQPLQPHQTRADVGEAVPFDTPFATPFAPRPISAPTRLAQDLFASMSLPLPSGTDLPALAALLAAPGSGVLRAKGLALDGSGQGQVLQVASGRWSVTPTLVTGPGRLVLIGLRGKMLPGPTQPTDLTDLVAWIGASAHAPAAHHGKRSGHAEGDA